VAERGLSQRHICRLLEVDPKTVRRPERRGDEAVRARLRRLAGERRRFGYRRLGILLEREGVRMNHKKLYRLYHEEGLAVRRRRGRKRATGTRASLALPQAPDQRWSLDFVSDCLAARRFRILVVVDDFTRECLAAVTPIDNQSGDRRPSIRRRPPYGGWGPVRRHGSSGSRPAYRDGLMAGPLYSLERSNAVECLVGLGPRSGNARSPIVGRIKPPLFSVEPSRNLTPSARA
jgi:transposase InsO family protein